MGEYTKPEQENFQDAYKLEGVQKLCGCFVEELLLQFSGCLYCI